MNKIGYFFMTVCCEFFQCQGEPKSGLSNDHPMFLGVCRRNYWSSQYMSVTGAIPIGTELHGELRQYNVVSHNYDGHSMAFSRKLNQQGTKLKAKGGRTPPQPPRCVATVPVVWPLPRRRRPLLTAAVVFAAMLLLIASQLASLLLYYYTTKVKRGTRRVPFVSHKLHNRTVYNIFSYFFFVAIVD